MKPLAWHFLVPFRLDVACPAAGGLSTGTLAIHMSIFPAFLAA